MTYSEVKSAVDGVCRQEGVQMYCAFSKECIAPLAMTAVFARTSSETVREIPDTDAKNRYIYIESNYSLRLIGAEDCFAKFIALYEKICALSGVFQVKMGACSLSSLNKQPVTEITFSSISVKTAAFSRRENEELLTFGGIKVLLEKREMQRCASAYGLTLATGDFRRGSTGESLSPAELVFFVRSEDESKVKTAFESSVGSSAAVSVNGILSATVTGTKLTLHRSGELWTQVIFDGYRED